MRAPEITHRVIEQAKKFQARKMTGGWNRFAGPAGVVPKLPGLAEAVDGAQSALREEAAQAAAGFMAGRFSSLGVTWPLVKLTDGPDAVWHLDPVTSKHWPSDRYCYDISYRGSTEMGDIKYVWEFGRLQFLQPVALHARLSGDAAALAFIERAIASWHASNSPFQGVGWSSGIELSLRVISLLVVTSLVGDQLGEVTRRQIEQMLRGHAFWLARYPSRFSSANNHLVSEEAALYLIGAVCPFVPSAKVTAARARAALIRETMLQILADGVAAEQSPTYGALTSELLLLAAWVAKGLGAPMPASVDSRLNAFANWINWLAEPDGRVPAIGDDDEGRVLTLGGDEPTYATSVAAAIAGFTGRIDRVPPHEATFRNALMPRVAVSPRPAGTHRFAEGGYTVHRAGEGDHTVTLVVDHAPLGYLAIAAHGHADALAFTLAINGRPTIVDPGTYLYHSGHEWRDWFRNTRAHNTVTVEGAEQSIVSGAFNWSHKARARLESLTEMPFVLRASHDGYQDRFGVRHVRRVEMAKGVLTLGDALIGGTERAAEIVLQLAADCTATINCKEVVVSRDGALIARIAFPDGGTVSTSRGENQVDGGWVSPQFGVKVPATRLAWTGRIGAEGVVTRVSLA